MDIDKFVGLVVKEILPGQFRSYSNEILEKAQRKNILPVLDDTFLEIFCIWLLVIGHCSFHGLIRHKVLLIDSQHLDDCYNSQNIFGIVLHSFERSPQLCEFCSLKIHGF